MKNISMAYFVIVEMKKKDNELMYDDYDGDNLIFKSDRYPENQWK